MLMELFQGYYRDRSDGGWDYRYFSAVYPTLRIVFVILYAITHSDFTFSLTILFSIAVVICLLLIQPYKEIFKLHNTMDIMLILSLIAFLTSWSGLSTPLDKDEFPSTFSSALVVIFSLVPLLYFTVLVLRGSKLYLTRSCIQTCYNMLESQVKQIQ